MSSLFNQFNQLIGKQINNWQPAKVPQAVELHGIFCDVVPLNPALHATSLYKANLADDGRMWTYLPYGPFNTLQAYQLWLNQICAGKDPIFYAIIDKVTQQAIGIASYLRIDAGNGSIEVGHIAYSPQLQRSTAATEAMYLMMAQAFQLGYRRYEWKCNALNAPSCRAAERLGFTLEGIFRQSGIVKGHNRDTAWYSIIDSEWPALKNAFQLWLQASNFDLHGKQITKLRSGAKHF